MPGFLDQNAPSPEAEHSHYLDGDILGKLIAKSFLMNRARYSANEIYIPVGRYGDADNKSASDVTDGDYNLAELGAEQTTAMNSNLTTN